MLKLIVSATVLIAVAGKIPSEAGVPVPFDFTLKCVRKPADELRAILDKGLTMTEVVRLVAIDWTGVHGEDGQPVQFSPAALEQLLNIPGMAKVAYDAYFEGCGAKAKN